MVLNYCLGLYYIIFSFFLNHFQFEYIFAVNHGQTMHKYYYTTRCALSAHNVNSRESMEKAKVLASHMKARRRIKLKSLFDAWLAHIKAAKKAQKFLQVSF